MPDTLQAPTSAKKEKILVYFLAASQDQQECTAIEKYLSPALRNSRIPVEISSDFEIPAGEDTGKYKERLYSADIVIAFISADFIDDEETYQRTKKVIARYNNHETIMLPILVRNCLWKSTPFVNLSLLPKNFQPLNNKQFWNSEDDALTAVVTDISDSINAFSEYTDSHISQPKEIKIAPQNLVDEPGNPVAPEAKTLEADPQPALQKDNRSSAVTDALQASRIPMNENWRGQYYKAVLWKRAAAFFLDNFLVLLPAYMIPFLFAGVISGVSGREGDMSDGELNIWMWSAFAFYFIVCAAMESSKWKGTFGKQIMKLQITDEKGHPISFFRALWRNIIRCIVGYSYLLVIPLIVQYYTFKKSRKLFHDQLSNTVIGEKLKK